MIKMNDDDVHYIDDGGVRASEPPGEGAVGWNVASIVNDDDVDGGGGGGQCVDFLLFLSKSGLLTLILASKFGF